LPIRKTLSVSPGVVVELIGVRGLTSKSVFYVPEISPVGGSCGPADSIPAPMNDNPSSEHAIHERRIDSLPST
jgi:hypothetical protein